MSDLEKRFSMLKTLIDRAFSTLFGSEATSEKREAKVEGEYSSLEDYKRRTGKRFRRTSSEIDRGLSPEEAFAERSVSN